VTSHWVQENVVGWPRVTNATKFLKDRTTPTYAWWRFPLIKVKTTSGVLQFVHFDIELQAYTNVKIDSIAD